MDAPSGAFESFFSPRSVALIGASRDHTKLGFGVARNLAEGGFAGTVHFVNPAAPGELLGRTVYRTVADLPETVDLAVLLVPARLVPGALDECGQRGIKAVIVSSGGFREIGPAGEALESACRTVAAAHSMRVLGPNCIGTIDTHSGLNTTFLAPPGPKPGAVAFVSHSGAVCAAAIDWFAGRGVGLSRLVSLGNQIDVHEVDALEMVASDPAAGVAAMYLETVADGRRLVEVAGDLTIPVLAFKAGRSKAGKRAVASHTGAMAGNDEAYRAACRRAGIIVVPTLEALLDAARTLAWTPLPAGRNMAVLTNAGGPGVAAADALEESGLSLSVLSPATRAELAGSLPAGAGVANPVDMLASARPEDFARSLRILVDAEEVDGVLVVYPPPPMFAAELVAEALVPVAAASGKPVLVAVMGDRTVEKAASRLRAAEVPDFRFPEPAAAALAILADRADRLSAPPASPVLSAGIDSEAATGIIDGCASGWLGHAERAALMEACGIAVPPATVVATADEAVEAAGVLRKGVALKLEAPDVIHKSDVGGVHLGLRSAQEIRSAFARLAGAVPTASPHPFAVLVQTMAGPGQDVIVGGIRDAQFGPLVMFGSGGIEVEAIRDVAFALAPLTRGDLAHLLSGTRAGRRLAGHRSIPPGDVQAVEDVLLSVGWLLSEQPRIAEIEINPLRVFAPGSGTTALDVRVRVT